MALLTPSQFEEHFDTDLGDDALGRLLGDAEDEIIRLFGAHVTQVEHIDGLGRLLFLQRRVASVTMIVETVAEEDTTLATDDWQLENVRILRRLADGTNARTYWGDRVTVTYVPESETNRRKRVQVDLVKLAIQHEGLKIAWIGNVKLDTSGYRARRMEILNSLTDPLGFA